MSCERKRVLLASVSQPPWPRPPYKLSHGVRPLCRQDLKFVQAELRCCALVTVVSRYKRDFLSLGRRGGRVASNVDSRVAFTAPRNAFSAKEHFVVQVTKLKAFIL